MQAEAEEEEEERRVSPDVANGRRFFLSSVCECGPSHFALPTEPHNLSDVLQNSLSW